MGGALVIVDPYKAVVNEGFNIRDLLLPFYAFPLDP
jgi:hypothetical protein